jgi:Icc-related predicted phosphoesterase
VPALPWTYLQDESVVIAGLRIWGSPWTPWFFDWAFNAPKTDPDEAFLDARYATAPDDCDVLVVHGPPAGYGDLTARGEAVGSKAFLRLLDAVSPKLGVFGHIHEGRGRWQRGATRLANASAVDLDYRLVDEPVMVFELEDDAG